MKSLLAASGLALALSFGAGCMQAPQGPRIRVATATAADLAAAENQDVVWYEFAPGDVVPVTLAFFGVMEGGAQGPVGFRAKRRFWFVMSKNQPMRLSFDGQTFAQPNSSQTVIAVVPRRDGQGGQLGWFVYMGESGDPEAELKELIERPASDKPQQQAKR